MTVVYSAGRSVTVTSSPMAQLREAVTEVSRALEDTTWTNLSIDERRGDVPYEERQVLITRSRRFVRRHPLAKQASKLLVNYVLGQGVTLRANDKAQVAKIVDEFWEDPVNRAVFTSQTAMAEALKTCFSDGNLFLVLFPDTEEGTVQLGMLDAMYVEDIVSDPENWKVRKWYKVRKPKGEYDFKAGVWQPSGADDFVWYRDWRNDDATGGKGAPKKVEAGLVYHVTINPRGLFGESEIAAALDWLKAHKDFMEDRATINRAAATIAWRKKQKGTVASVTADAARLRSRLADAAVMQGYDNNPPPVAGSTIVENEASTMEWVKTDTGGPAALSDERVLRMMLGAGMGGIPNHIFGDEASANLATATAMGTPMNKAYEQWQKLLGDLINDILTFVLETAHEAERLGPKDDSKKYTNAPDELSHGVLRTPSALPSGNAPAAGPLKQLEPGKLAEHGSKDHAGYEKLHPNSGRAQPATSALPATTGPDVVPTNQRYVLEDGRWMPERVALHDKYVNAVQQGVPSDAVPTVYMTGGGPASGKSEGLLKNKAVGIPGPGKAAYIDADSAKAVLPEYDPAKAGLVHEESSYMSKAALFSALRNGHSVVYDTVGDSGIDNLSKKIAEMRDAAPGNEKIFADYATVPVDVAVSRATARARQVPLTMLRKAYRDIPQTVLGAIQRGIFDRLRVWDTNVPLGTNPALIAEFEKGSGLNVLDGAKWQSFLTSGQGA